MPEGGHTPRAPIHCVLWHAPSAPPAFELTALLAQRGLTLETCDDPFAAAARVCRHERAQRARRRAAEQRRLEAGSSEASALVAESAPAEPTPEGEAPALVLLLAEPTGLAMRDAVGRVLEVHAPRTICWVYERAGGPRLRTVALAALGRCAEVSGPVDVVADPGLVAPLPEPAGPVRPEPAVSESRGPATPVLPVSRPASLGPTRPGADASRTRPPEPPRSLVDPHSGRAPSGGQVPINSASVLTDEELAMLLSDDDPAPRRGRTTS